MLAPASTPAFTTNGFSMALQGPAGNYLIEAPSDISNPTNWQPILFFSKHHFAVLLLFHRPDSDEFQPAVLSSSSAMMEAVGRPPIQLKRFA